MQGYQSSGIGRYTRMTFLSLDRFTLPIYFKYEKISKQDSYHSSSFYIVNNDDSCDYFLEKVFIPMILFFTIVLRIDLSPQQNT